MGPAQGLEQRANVGIEQRPDAFDAEIGRRIGGNNGRIQCVVPLTREDGRQAMLHDPLHGRENAQFVVDHHVMPRRIVALHGVEHLLLVDVDQHAAGNSSPKARALNLARLKDHVAIGQDHSAPEGVQALDDIKGVRIEALRERIVDEEGRHL